MFSKSQMFTFTKTKKSLESASPTWEFILRDKRHYHLTIYIMAKHGKNYVAAAAKVDADKKYSLKEATTLAVETSTVKFDASVELHMNLNIDVKHADQMVRGTITLPNGTGKKVRIAAFVEADQEKAAKDAGAELVGLEELVKQVQKGELNFDIAIAQPSTMKELGKIAKVLGPKGLMPSPKAGTVTQDVAKTIEEIKKGQVEYKADKNGIVHCMFGKVSFGADKLLQNAEALVEAILAAKPSAVKGAYVKSTSVSSSMGPGILVDVA